MKFRSKPKIIEAIQWDGSYEKLLHIETLFTGLETISKAWNNNKVFDWRIQTLEGELLVSPKDWIIKGIAGEFYPCRDDIFRKSYEAIDD